MTQDQLLSEFKKENARLRDLVEQKNEAMKKKTVTPDPFAGMVTYRKERFEMLGQIFGRKKKVLRENEVRTSDAWSSWFEVTVPEDATVLIAELLKDGYELKPNKK